jgi:hypothetical protein
MKHALILAGAVGVGMAGVLGAAALGLRHETPSVKRDQREGATNVAPSRAGTPRVRAETPDAPPILDIDTLLADGSPGAWGRIASLYPASDEAAKRKVLQHIARLPELHRMLGYLLATVGEDPTPPASDPMLDEASALIRSRFSKFEDYEYGRQTMVMQKTDKRRWLLANALIGYGKDLHDSEYGELKGTLQAKLIDVHSDVKDGFVRHGIVSGLRALGGGDAALILEKGGDVTDAELASVAEEQAAAQKVLAEANGH